MISLFFRICNKVGVLSYFSTLWLIGMNIARLNYEKDLTLNVATGTLRGSINVKDGRKQNGLYSCWKKR